MKVKTNNDIKARGMTQYEQSFNVNQLRGIQWNVNDILGLVALKMATRNGEPVPDVPPSIVFIENVIGEMVSSEYSRYIKEEDGIYFKPIKEGFKYPNDGSDCYEVLKNIIDIIIGISDDNLGLTENQINNTKAYMKPYIAKVSSVYASLPEAEMFEEISKDVKGIDDTTDNVRSSKAKSTYTSIVIKAIDEAIKDFVENETDLYQWELPTLSINLSPIYEDQTQGFRGGVEDVDGLDTKQICSTLRLFNAALKRVTYLSLDNNKNINIDQILYKQEYSGKEETELPKEYVDYRNAILSNGGKSIYKDWITALVPKMAMFVNYLPLEASKDEIRSKSKIDTAYKMLEYKSGENSGYQKIKKATQTGYTNRHPDFMLFVGNCPAEKSMYSAMSVTDVSEPTADVLLGVNRETKTVDKSFKKKYYELFKQVASDIDFNLISVFRNRISVVKILEDFNNFLSRVENVSGCTEGNRVYGKTWLEKLEILDPNFIEQNRSFIEDKIGINLQNKGINDIKDVFNIDISKTNDLLKNNTPTTENLPQGNENTQQDNTQQGIPQGNENTQQNITQQDIPQGNGINLTGL